MNNENNIVEKHCLGCGVLLQDESILNDGYTTDLSNDICQRCFRMKNYGEYQYTTKTNEEYIEILKSINETKDLVVYIVDVLNISKDISFIREYINNKIVLVLNKRDVLPKSVKDEKLINYVKNNNDIFEDVVVVSADKNYNLDYLISVIKKNQTTKRVYFVGNTNAGKSSLINKLMKNYSDNLSDLTISPLPSTTLSTIEIELSESLMLVDTPGLVDKENLINYVDFSMLKKITPKKEIKPKTYQIRKGQCLVIDNIFRIDYVEGDKNSFTVYTSNNLKVKKYNALKCKILKDMKKTSFDVGFHEDIVINGCGFVKIVEKAKVDVYLDQNVGVFTRKSLI